jgi:signal transduction histidine kinase
MVTLDQKKFRYILANLLSNAIKYSQENKDISVQTKNMDGQLALCIKDQGIGIPLEEQKHLFEKFFRANNTGNVQGTGLGLTIVKRYVELMGGTLDFISAVGTGTTFNTSIPHI